ncbi:39S ribosomal protein L41, mitochondrial-like [Asterias rubens]|uniref:39S ribosomal protein L41, mitochondrial-like n=1 Tax=Asterias rubens TaxID=7604 RepID=UPI0014553D2E|nr:39S ribosomal protein L41, mitochondrial-like [Asterias rubens]
MPVIKDLIKGLYRGANRHKEMTSKRGNKNFHPSRGLQRTGIKVGLRFKNVQEMIPEIVVPNLEGFTLKAYVSHKCPDTTEPPITARDIFDACVAPQVKADFKDGKFNSVNVTSESSSEGVTKQSNQSR